MGTPAGVQGALVGLNVGAIANSYSLADTRFCTQCMYEGAHGGLIAVTSTTPDYPSKVAFSYAAGRTAPPAHSVPVAGPCETPVDSAGAAVGCDGSASSFDSTYWVTDSSKHDPKSPAGNKGQLPGVAGLTSAQMKAALPSGFDPKVWGRNSNIDGGYPYLLNNPPQ